MRADRELELASVRRARSRRASSSACSARPSISTVTLTDCPARKPRQLRFASSCRVTEPSLGRGDPYDLGAQLLGGEPGGHQLEEAVGAVGGGEGSQQAGAGAADEVFE